MARIEALAAKIEQARGLRREAVAGVEALYGAIATKSYEAAACTFLECSIGGTVQFRQDLIRPSDGKSGKLRFIGLQHVESHTGKKIGEDCLSANDLSGRKFVFSPGEIVYGYLRPYLNKVWVSDCEGVCSVDQYVIQPRAELIDTQYLANFMRSPIFLEKAVELTNNLMLPRLRMGLLESIPIPLPPLPEQRRIVAYLDDLQSKVDAVKRLQAETAAELDALLPAVLDKAFRGEL